MRNEIFNKIKANRMHFYQEITEPKRIEVDEIIVESNHQYKEQEKDLNSILMKLIKNCSITNFIERLRPKNVDFHFLGKGKNIFQEYYQNMKHFLIKKEDEIIEEFYQLGLLVFDDKVQNLNYNMEIIDDTNIFDELSKHKSNSILVVKFKKIWRNIFIFFEADSFTFDLVKAKPVSPDSKEIKHKFRFKETLSLGEIINKLPEINKKKKSNQKPSKAENIYFMGLKGRLINLVSTKILKHHIFRTNFLYPIINKFI